jgi:streptomycin 6-kinase
MNGRGDDGIEFMRERAVDGAVEDLQHKACISDIERAGNARRRKRVMIDGEDARRVRPACAGVIRAQRYF